MAKNYYRSAREQDAYLRERKDMMAPRYGAAPVINAPRYKSTYKGLPLKQIDDTLSTLDKKHWSNINALSDAKKAVANMDIDEKDAPLINMNLAKINESMTLGEKQGFENMTRNVISTIEDITSNPHNIQAMKDSAKIKQHNKMLDQMFAQGKIDESVYRARKAEKYASVLDESRKIGDNFISDLDLNNPVSKFDYEAFAGKLARMYKANISGHNIESPIFKKQNANGQWTQLSDSEIKEQYGYTRQQLKELGLSPQMLENSYKLTDFTKGYNENAHDGKQGFELALLDKFMRDEHAMAYAKELADAYNKNNNITDPNKQMKAADILLEKTFGYNEMLSGEDSFYNIRMNRQFTNSLVSLNAAKAKKTNTRYKVLKNNTLMDLDSESELISAESLNKATEEYDASIKMIESDPDYLDENGEFNSKLLPGEKLNEYNNLLIARNANNTIRNLTIAELAKYKKEDLVDMLSDYAGYNPSVFSRNGMLNIAGVNMVGDIRTTVSPIAELRKKNEEYIEKMIDENKVGELIKNISVAPYITNMMKIERDPMAYTEYGKNNFNLSKLYKESLKKLSENDLDITNIEVQYNIAETDVGKKVKFGEDGSEKLILNVNDDNFNLQTDDGLSQVEVMRALETYLPLKNGERKGKIEITSQGLISIGSNLYWKSTYKAGENYISKRYMIPYDQLSTITGAYKKFGKENGDAQLVADMNLLEGLNKYGGLWSEEVNATNRKTSNRKSMADEVNIPTSTKKVTINGNPVNIITYPGSKNNVNISRVGYIALADTGPNIKYLDSDGKKYDPETQTVIRNAINELHNDFFKSIEVGNPSVHTINQALENKLVQVSKKYNINKDYLKKLAVLEGSGSEVNNFADLFSTLASYNTGDKK